MTHLRINRPRFYPLYNVWLDNAMNSQLGGHAIIHRNDEQGVMGEQFIDINGGVDQFANFNPYKSKVIDVSGGLQKYEIIYLTGQNQATDFRYYGGSSSVGFNYFGICGHNFESSNCKMRLAFHKKADDTNTELDSWVDVPMETIEPLFNCSVILGSDGYKWIIPTRSQLSGDEIDHNVLSNGSFMFKIDPDECDAGYSRWFKIILEPMDDDGFDKDIEIGSFVWGRYFDMPQSPDLTYSMTYEYDGIKSKRTVGGSDITNISYTGSPGFCGKYEGFGRENNDFLAMHGRRSYKMNFSALRSGYEDLSPHDEWDPDDKSFLFPQTHLSNTVSRYENAFLSRVLRYSMNGQLPFIFEADTTVLENDTNVTFWAAGEHDEAGFMVAKFPKNSFDFKQSTHKLFDVSMEVVESW